MESHPLILELLNAGTHRGQQQTQLLRVRRIGVVEIQILFDLAQCEAQLLAAQDQDHPSTIAQRVHAHDAESEQAARLIAEESSRLYDAMHGLIPRLAPLVLDSFGLTEALNDLGERTRRSHPDVAIDLSVDLGATALAGDEALALYRAAQEGITNALRHGCATAIRLALCTTAAGLTLDLIDNGQGLPAEGAQRDGHYGLRWLAERVEGLGGQFKIEAASPRGVHLQVRLAAGRTPLEIE